MKTVIDRFEGIAELAGVKIAIGGAPVSQVFSEEIGADGYGADASSSVEMFLRFISDGSASPSHARVA
jgi:5-methyltetrahydrofolate--homocysteine methyltransferase